MFSKAIFAGSFLAAVAYGQSIETSAGTSVAATTTASQVMPPVATQAFNPAPIDPNEAFSWCIAQLNTCPIICGGSANPNTCDSTTFTYSCVCSNGTVPDVTAFEQTLPFFMCQATYAQCVEANPDNAIGQNTCSENAVCGTRNATSEALATVSPSSSSETAGSTSSPSASESATGSETATDAAASPTDSGNAAVAMSQHVTTGAFVAVLMAAIKLLL